MALCRDCDQEMTTAPTRTAEVLLIRHGRHQRRRWRPPHGMAELDCGDCGVAPGGVHHLGCDLERCPLCGWQLISCGCGDGADEEGSDVRAIAG